MDCLKLFQRRNDMNRVAMVFGGVRFPSSPIRDFFGNLCEYGAKWSKAVKGGFITHSEGFNSLLRSKEQGLFRIGLFWRGEAWSGKAVWVRFGGAWCVRAVRGTVGCDLVRQSRCSLLRSGEKGSGMARLGTARLGSCGSVRSC